MAAAGDVYFQFVDSYGATDFTWLSDPSTGIWNIEAAGDKEGIYLQDGRYPGEPDFRQWCIYHQVER